jgi:hypothetical protein
MHWIAPSDKDTANGALGKRLWDAADLLRANSGVKSQEYSAPVLGLIFLRFAEVRSAAQRAKLAKASASARCGSCADERAAKLVIHGVENANEIGRLNRLNLAVDGLEGLMRRSETVGSKACCAGSQPWSGHRLAWCVALVSVLAGCSDAPESSLAPAAGGTTEAWFEDVTKSRGLQFIHDTGAMNHHRVPAQMGSGAALFDYDNDGRLDIYLVQNAGPDSRSINRLFHQEPDGHFEDVSVGSGLDVAGFGMGTATGDVNNDGRTDVLLTEYGAIRLFLNQGAGHFTDVTEAAGLENSRWATSAAFFDYDRDGWLDLVVANYLDYDPTQECTDARGVPEFCGPHGFPGLVTKLFRNLGGPATRFSDVTVASGLALTPGPALGVLCADFDGDRWPDIFLADDGKPNRLFLNQHNGTFKEEAAVRGLAFGSMGQTAGNMGVALGDVDGDGLFDLFVTHLAEEHHALWTQRPRGFFQERMGASGLARQGWRGTGFGAVLGDFNCDGALDLAWVNGRVKRGNDSSRVASGVHPFWAPYAQRNQIFANDGKGVFRDVSEANAAFCIRPAVGRGLAMGDLDNDGALDFLTTGTGGPAQLFRNVAARRGHWLTVRAVEPALGGRDAYGAEITVRAGERSWWRLVNPGFSYLCSNDPRAHFGLGSAATVDGIEVVWPDGAQESFPSGTATGFLVLRRGSGKPAAAKQGGR